MSDCRDIPRRSGAAGVHAALLISPESRLLLGEAAWSLFPSSNKCLFECFVENRLWLPLLRGGRSWCQGPRAGSEELHLPDSASWDLRGAGAVPSPFFERYFSNNKAKHFPLVNPTPFLLLNTWFQRGGCVPVWKRSTVWNNCWLDIILMCLRLHAEILVSIFLRFNRCYFQTRGWCQAPATPTSPLQHRCSLVPLLNSKLSPFSPFHMK